jgi:hypothetical protein
MGSVATPQPAVAAMGRVALVFFFVQLGRGRRFASAEGLAAADVMGNLFVSMSSVFFSMSSVFVCSNFGLGGWYVDPARDLTFACGTAHQL